MDQALRATRQSRTRGRPKISAASESFVRWTPEERHRLFRLKNQHSHLDWNQFQKLGLFPDRTPRALQMTYERVRRGHVRRRKKSNPPKRSTSPSVEPLYEHHRKRLRLEEEDDDEYEETSSDGDTSDTETSCEDGSDCDEREPKDDNDLAANDARQSSDKPYAWNITTPTASGTTHIPEATGSLTRNDGTANSPITQNAAAYESNVTTTGEKRIAILAGDYLAQAAKNLLHASHAVERHETDVRTAHTRQEAQITFLKEEMDRMRQEIARMKQNERRYMKLEKTVEDLISSRRAEADEAILREVQKRLDDSQKGYAEIKRMVDELAGNNDSEIQVELESLQKRVESLEGLKSVSAFDMLQRLVGPNAK